MIKKENKKYTKLIKKEHETLRDFGTFFAEENLGFDRKINGKARTFTKFTSDLNSAVVGKDNFPRDIKT